VFLISGLWHGANWTFITWGGINGFYLVFAILIKNSKLAILDATKWTKFILAQNFIKVITTFLLITFAWIFFRAKNLGDAFYIIKKMASFKGSVFIIMPYTVIYPLMGILILMSVEIMDHFRHTQIAFFSHKNVAVRYASYLFIAVMILLFGVFDGGQFIYFQF
jgi:hypothetical protein